MKFRQMRYCIFNCLLIMGLLCSNALGAEIKDTESATHGDSASMYQITDTYEYPGFKLIQINLAVLSHYSYMIVSEGKALVVDPGRDIEFYLDTARAGGIHHNRGFSEPLPRGFCGRPHGDGKGCELPGLPECPEQG